MSSNEKIHQGCDGVGFWIVSTAHAFRQALECELTHKGITFRQWEVLSLLNKDGKQPQTDLAEKMGLEAQTLAGIISRMERDGWLTRTGCCSDRRRKLIEATEKARQIQNEMHEVCERVRNRAVMGLGDEQLQALKTICETMRDNLARECSDSDVHRGFINPTVIEQNEECDGSPSLEDTHVDLEETMAPTRRSRR